MKVLTMGTTISELNSMEAIRRQRTMPSETFPFTKVIYAVSRKSKKQVEDALNLEIKWLEDQNPTYTFKECRQGTPVKDCITFTIVFEIVK